MSQGVVQKDCLPKTAWPPTWNVSLDRIQELFESEKTIKEEKEKNYIENKDIKKKLTEEKDKIHNKIYLINNDILKVINASEEKVLAEIISSEEKVMNDIDTKVAKISSEIEEKLQLYILKFQKLFTI